MQSILTREHLDAVDVRLFFLAVGDEVFVDEQVDFPQGHLPDIRLLHAQDRCAGVQEPRHIDRGAPVLVGVILNAFVPKVHSYAFMIIIVFVLKALDIVPKELEETVVMFNRVIMTNLTHAVLAGIGLAMIDLTSLAQAMTWQFVLISLTSVVSMGLASWILGQVLGMYPVETAIGAGMINNSMGGTGNIAVLSAADRMEMIAFAQMANRLGGAIVLILGGILIQFLH